MVCNGYSLGKLTIGDIEIALQVRVVDKVGVSDVDACVIVVGHEGVACEHAVAGDGDL